jgi:Flp pilus assembly protein TadD
VTEVEDDEADDSLYDRYRRASALLESGSPDAAAVLLARLRIEDPGSTSVLEAHARALFDGHRYLEAAAAFGELVERSPAEDYAHYGLGLSLWRLQRFPEARDHLAMAFVMRPSRSEYGTALGQVKATLRSRALAGLPLEGPINDPTDSQEPNP